MMLTTHYFWDKLIMPEMESEWSYVQERRSAFFGSEEGQFFRQRKGSRLETEFQIIR